MLFNFPLNDSRRLLVLLEANGQRYGMVWENLIFYLLSCKYTTAVTRSILNCNLKKRKLLHKQAPKGLKI